MLQHGYRGSISKAQCSSAIDAKQIMEAIGTNACKVDACIDVLLAAGMSTSHLRLASKRGVDIAGAGRMRFSRPLLGWALTLCCSVDPQNAFHTVAFHWMQSVLIASWLPL